MRELIYKDEAYKAIDNCICDGWYRISPTEAKMNIRHLVSDANRLQGEWIEIKRYWEINQWMYEIECSVCKERIKNPYEPHFCPNCGCAMTKEGE